MSNETSRRWRTNRVMDLGSWWSEAVAVSVAFCTLLSSINVAIIPVLNSVV